MWPSPHNSPYIHASVSRIDSLLEDQPRVSPFLVSQNRKRRIFGPLLSALTEMEFDYHSESQESHISFLADEKIPPSPPPAAVEMQRQEHTQQWPPWLREEIADRRRQLDASRETQGRHNLTKDHFGIVDDHFDVQHTLVSNWLDALPERLIDGWETVLREEVEETFIKRHSKVSSCRYSKASSRRPSHIRLEANEVETGFYNGCHDEEFSVIDDNRTEEEYYHDDMKAEQEIEDDFLRKVLRGRKRLMQAEISVKRLKMGLKYVANGMCDEFGDAADAQRTRNLLAAVNSTFEEVVRKRLSTATVKGVDPKEDYRTRLQDLHEREPTLMSKIYTEKEIRELKNMVEDILSMDGRRVDGEGKKWFLRNLPRLLELREDMALAEKEIERKRMVENESKLAFLDHGRPEQATFLLLIIFLSVFRELSLR
jgi:hypothetical protein